MLGVQDALGVLDLLDLLKDHLRLLVHLWLTYPEQIDMYLYLYQSTRPAVERYMATLQRVYTLLSPVFDYGTRYGLWVLLPALHRHVDEFVCEALD
jgi:hypothetical protein